jgi:hypothetical protein
MSQEEYIGMDVPQATISVAVIDADGRLIMECLLETKAVTWAASFHCAPHVASSSFHAILRKNESQNHGLSINETRCTLSSLPAKSGPEALWDLSHGS